MAALNLNTLVREAHEKNDYDALISLIPYAKLIGIECLRLGDDMVFRLPASKDNIGNPILPVIKICANPKTVRTMSEHVDVDTSGLLRREMTMSDAGDALLDCMMRTINGRLTSAEALGHREFVLTRLYESA